MKEGTGASGKIPSQVPRILGNEAGQAITEYVVILLASIAGCVLLAKGFLGTLDSGLLKLGGQLEKDLKTGRSLPVVWKN